MAAACLSDGLSLSLTALKTVLLPVRAVYCPFVFLTLNFVYLYACLIICLTAFSVVLPYCLPLSLHDFLSLSPFFQSLLQSYLRVSPPRTSPSPSPSLSASWSSSPKVSVVLRTQHVSICSIWPVSALCSSTRSALNCPLFHLRRVFLFLATACTHSRARN